GGGGKMLAEYLLPELGIATLIEDSQMANVNGYMKLGQKVFGANESGSKATGETTASTNNSNTGTSHGNGSGNSTGTNPTASGTGNTGTASPQTANTVTVGTASSITGGNHATSENRFANSKFFENSKPFREESAKR
ncbi:MAG TPA: hypothetical protein VEC37_06725, partial [Bacillota bacterium]|nr:hypothetical protein [Bacillota bacterium]